MAGEGENKWIGGVKNQCDDAQGSREQRIPANEKENARCWQHVRLA